MEKLHENNIDRYRLLRLQKTIKLKTLALYMGCTSALLSMYEHKKIRMSKGKETLYRYYIDNYEKLDKS